MMQTNFPREARNHPPHRMAGLSLVELLIAIAIGLLIVAGVVTVFVNASGARSEIERTSRQIENGRYALELLTDDMRMAGYYGEFTITAGAPAPMPDPCSVTPADWIAAMPLHLQGYPSGGAMPACLPGTVTANSPALVVRRVRGCVAGDAGCPAVTANKGYLQVALCDTETAVVATQKVLDLQSAAFPLTRKDCATPAYQREYLVHIYFVSSTNGAGQNIPTLKRMELTNTGAVNPFAEQALVEGVERLHFEYGIDSNGDGLPDVYNPDPSLAPCAASPCTALEISTNWANVMTVQIYVLVRNIDLSPGYTDTKTYRLGSIDVNPDPAFLKHRRHVYSSVVRISNPAGRRDTP